MAPKRLKIELGFQKFLKEHPQILKRPLAIACSGGVDSVVLAELCASHFDNTKGLELVYVNHGQRNSVADDIKTLKALSKKTKARLTTLDLKIRKRASENEMRQARYDALIRFCHQKKITTLFLAHHEDDQLETYIYRILRGTHPESLEGMSIQREMDGVDIFRPLLHVSREAILEFAAKNHVQWSEDETNQDLHYARNAIRAKLIPWFDQLYPKGKKHFLEFLNTLTETNKSQRRSSIDEQKSCTHALQSGQGILTKELQFSVLKASIDGLLRQKSSRTTKKHWENLQKILDERQMTRQGGGPVKTVQFPGGYSLVFKGNRLFWNPSK